MAISMRFPQDPPNRTLAKLAPTYAISIWRFPHAISAGPAESKFGETCKMFQKSANKANERLEVLKTCNCEEYDELKEIIEGKKKSKY